MDISLIICTRNRADTIEKCLTSIACLTFKGDWECILVDNASTDSTLALLQSWALTVPFSVRVLHEPKVGVSNAKNLGIAHARGELIAFTDDDCYPQEDFLTQVNHSFEHNELAFVGGRILLFDKKDYPITIQTSEVYKNIPPRSFIRTGLIHGANYSFRRNALVEIGLFDVAFGGGTPFPCEDVDILARLSAAGFHGAYDPEPLVFHHHKRKKLTEVKQLMEYYDVGRGAYYAKCIKNPSIRWIYIFNWLRLARKDFFRFIRELMGAYRYTISRFKRQKGTSNTHS
tara:strand:+ start:7591 stop:8451 length:861 start_codon:yes stop_codon:yes gene_type:complete